MIEFKFLRVVQNGKTASVAYRVNRGDFATVRKEVRPDVFEDVQVFQRSGVVEEGVREVEADAFDGIQSDFKKYLSDSFKKDVPILSQKYDKAMDIQPV